MKTEIDQDIVDVKEALGCLASAINFIIDWALYAFFFTNVFCIAIATRQPTMKEAVLTIACGIVIVWRDKRERR